MKQDIHGGDVYRHPQVLDFSANINPLGTPEGVIRAARESMARIAQYPDVRKEALIEALSVYEHVPEEWLICGNGAAELIFALGQALRPKKALLLAPTFAEYGRVLSGIGCEIRPFFLQDETGFFVGSEIKKVLTEDLDLVFLCNPNNPTGLLMDPKLLREVVSLCREKKIWLVVDECFLDFVPQPEFHTLKELCGEYKNLFLLKAFTKRYAMAGLRLGYGISANQRLLDQMEEQMQPWNVSLPAQEAGVAALKENAYLEKSRTLIEWEKQYLKKELVRCGCRVYDSQANYIFFQSTPDLYEKLLKEGIMIRDCSNYPGLMPGYYRIAVRLHEENERLIKAIEKVRKQ